MDADRGIGCAGTTADECDAGLSADLGIPIGCKRGAGLMPVGDQPDTVGMTTQTFENCEVTFAGDTENGVDTMAVQGANKSLACIHGSGNLDDCVNLDRNIQRQGRGTDGSAGVTALVTEDFDHQVAGAVYDFGMIVEGAVCIHEPAQTNNAHNPVQIAIAGGLDLGNDVEGAKSCCLITFINRELLAQFALILQFTVFQGDLTGDEHVVAADDIGYIVGRRSSRLRQLDTKFIQACVNRSGHRFSPTVRWVMFHPTYGVSPAASTTVRLPMDDPSPATAKRARLGVILVAMGAIGFGLLPLFLEVLRAEQVGSGTSLVVRYAGAAVPLAIWVAWRRPVWRGVVLSLVAGVGIGGGTIFLFEGYAGLPASVTVLIFYTYPAFTLLFARVFFGVRIERRMVLAIIMVLLAAGLILSPGGVDASLYPLMLITFGAPAGYAIYLACLGRIPEGTDAGLRTLLLSLSALVVAVVYLLTAEGTFSLPFSTMGWISLFYMAAVTGIGATLLIVIGAGMTGSSRAAVAGSSELVMVLILSWWIFGDVMRLEAVFGAALILAAIIVSLPRDRSRAP
jgi:drug/metabolite transporter (DMT)-like permease